MANVLVFAERREGELKRPALEAVAVGRRLADSLGGSVAVLGVGPGAAEIAAAVGACGADRLFVVEDAHLGRYAPEAYAAEISEAARRVGATIVLVAGTAMGRDLAPRAAARLGAGCLSDLVEIEAREDGTIRGLRPVYSGKAYARIASRGPIAVAVLRPNVFGSPIAAPARSPAVEVFAAALPAGNVRVRVTAIEKAGEQEQDVAEASIVVSGGRGLKGAENFALVRELARALGGAVGASRAAVDAGWIPHAHQVGQTGKVVSPKLYVACGISGAIQHLAGMSSSKVIVAVNKDPEAPIFKIADYAVVGDLFEVLPALTAEVGRVKDE
jgi:electron transfer flavoprotein alpha subunit